LYTLRPFGAWAPKNPSRATPFVGFFSVTFLRLLECSAFLYRNRKNVVYNRNVRRNKIYVYENQDAPPSMAAQKNKKYKHKLKKNLRLNS
jgi:hypothetical protein